MKKEFQDKLPKNINIALLGLQGSRALGIENPNCDWDYRGVYIAKNKELLSFDKPKEQYEYVDKELDYVIYEAKKFLRLAMQCNPSILQLLFLSSFEIETEIGKIIVANRKIFLSNIAKKTYAGYAMSQILPLKKSDAIIINEKLAKSIRHCFRLFEQGRELLETGKITVRLKNPERFFEISKMKKEKILELFEQENEKFMKIKTILPDQPDIKEIGTLLMRIRSFGDGSLLA